MSKHLRFGIALAAILFAAQIIDVLYAAQPETPAQPQTPPGKHKADEIIVKYRDGVDEYKKEIGRFRVGGQRKKEFKIVPGLEVIKLGRNVSVEEAIEAYKQDPDVLYAEPNYILYLTANAKINMTPNDPAFGSLWGLTKINAPGAWNITTGNANLAVGILDSGFDYNHPDLSANIFNNPSECVADGADNDGNG